MYTFVAPSQVVQVRYTDRKAPRVTGSSCAIKQGEMWDNKCGLGGGNLGILGLPMACRMTYAESIPVFYRQICFLFLTLHPWKAFCDSLLKFQTSTPGALQSLRSVQIDFRVLGWATFTAQDEATLRASLELLTQQALSLQNFYIHLAPRPRNSARLPPLTLDLFRALSKMRGLKHFDFSVHHPLHRIPMERLSSFSAGQRKLYEEKVINLKKTLDGVVHVPRGVPTAGMDAVLQREFARIMAAGRSDT